MGVPIAIRRGGKRKPVEINNPVGVAYL